MVEKPKRDKTAARGRGSLFDSIHAHTGISNIPIYPPNANGINKLLPAIIIYTMTTNKSNIHSAFKYPGSCILFIFFFYGMDIAQFITRY
jgi:hypothetical protein